MPSVLSTARRETLCTLLLCFSKPWSLSGLVMMFMSNPRRCQVDGIFDALVTAASTNVAGHRFTDLVVTGFWIFHQQRCGLHDLAGLAEAALRHVFLAPRFLHRVIAGRVQSLDGRDLASGDIGHRRDAGANRLLVDNHGAGAAQRLATAEFRAGQSGLVAQIPQQCKIGVAVPGLVLSIDLEFDHMSSPQSLWLPRILVRMSWSRLPSVLADRVPRRMLAAP